MTWYVISVKKETFILDHILKDFKDCPIFFSTQQIQLDELMQYVLSVNLKIINTHRKNIQFIKKSEAICSYRFPFNCIFRSSKKCYFPYNQSNSDEFCSKKLQRNENKYKVVFCSKIKLKRICVQLGVTEHLNLIQLSK